MLKNSMIAILAVIVVLEALIIAATPESTASAPSKRSVAYSDFIHQVDAGQVSSASIQGTELTGMTKDNRRFQTYLPDDPTLIPHLIGANVRVTAMSAADSNIVLKTFLSWVPLLSIVGVWAWYLGRIARAISGISATIRTLPGKPEAREEV